jgi:two-component system sensor histidine kinase PilS (NtrC family)
MTLAAFDNDIQQVENDLHEQVWRPFYYFNFYRITLAALFLTLHFFKEALPILGSLDSHLYLITSISYLFIGIISIAAIQKRWPSFNALVYSLVLVDILALTLLMHASGGMESGLGMLIVVAIAGNSLITAGRTASLFAAIAALTVLAEQTYSHLTGIFEVSFSQAGILGISLFATAILAHAISKRLRETEALAAQRGIDLANLSELNEHVIKRLQSGVVVVDANDRIRLMNESAWHMLGLPTMKNTGNNRLSQISAELAKRLTAWNNKEVQENSLLRCPASNIDIMPSYTRLGHDANSGTLIFLEDASRMAQQAQQMKLVSLGRLTASIAHEIRNPLGAISHAGQLLAESPQLDTADMRLTEIIHNNSSRVNDIVENVLQLSRRGNSAPEYLNLNTWLQNFISDFAMGLNIGLDEIAVAITPEELEVHFDSTQLHQVLWNLCQNGIRYSMDHADTPKLELIGSIHEDSHRAFLDVIDHGPGIDPETAQNIFEPFFTTDKKGSGLGLYIARELCETNKAHLSYLPLPVDGSCFRIEFTTNPAA